MTSEQSSSIIEATCIWSRLRELLTPASRTKHSFDEVKRTSVERRQAAAHDRAFDASQLSQMVCKSTSKEETVLYLGYGSNLAAETFLGKRGIKPLSQVNIVAPSIALSFDLPGIPYSEPCFANSRYRAPEQYEEEKPQPPYHKNAWKKGLVGVVYEVTKEDYAHIIATEGGGAGYHDVVVDCWALDDDPKVLVPLVPKGKPFKAHTLYAHREQSLRSDPDYAQPSPRYLKLITSGAQEHNLPLEYRHFLSNIRVYHTTTTAQQLGSFLFLAIWGPLFAFFFATGKIFLRPDGTYPSWVAKFLDALFTAVWASYDGFFLKLFGDGERTIGDDTAIDEKSQDLVNEKLPLLGRNMTEVV